MDEFVQSISEEAKKAYLKMAKRLLPESENPILELIAVLLADDAGGVIQTPRMQITTDEWIRWNELTRNRRGEQIQAITELIKREQMGLPEEIALMKEWAATVVLLILDRLTVM